MDKSIVQINPIFAKNTVQLLDSVAKNSISVVVITFNEEKNIERCLSSIKDIADEVIVVDSYSTDKTKEICERFDVKFSENKFEGHIEQKNFALSKASNDMVLSLDADEALSEELNKKILEIKSRDMADAYEFNRLTSYCGHWVHHCGWYPDSRVRLWNRKKGKWGGTNPHDIVELDNDVEVKKIDLDILHYSYYSIDQHIDQINKFSSISAQEKAKKGKKASTILHLMIYPYWIFFKSYFLKLGFMDGYYGFVISVLNGYYRFLKYAKLKELTKN